MDVIPYETGAYYIFDRGNVGFERLYRITTLSVFFVVRAKANLKFNRMYSNKVDRQSGLICDQIGKLSGFYVSKDYPDKLRRIKFYDAESNRYFFYLTNNMDLSAEEIVLLYKNKWQVELFFKWIKQHLKIKAFWGTTENSVRLQIYSAIIVYCLVAIVGKELKIERSS